jgi:HD-GYP domain-containing protein (c-di-GMP phosphodiesterase class II)
MGHELETTLPSDTRPYRVGGDEFCVLSWADPKSHAEITAAAAAALTEHGQGFSITPSYGSAVLPADAATTTAAMTLADERMYARKSLDSRTSAGRQSADVLLKILSERNPDLGVHLTEVTALCQAVADKLGLPDEESGPLLQGASLHDVGKAAIPDEILAKPTRLDDEEWDFIRRHTLIGERILSVAPALHRASKLVRASHERFDGTGYPDKLVGDEIPLGARIIAVCDAYDAMTSERSYRAPKTPEQALVELQRCAGVQFDPEVVEAFGEAVAERSMPPVAAV